MLDQKSLFRAIFERAGLGMLLVDQSGHVLRANRTLQEWLGYSADELRSMTFDQFTFPEDIASDYDLFKELLQEKRTRYQVELRCIRNNGDVVWGRVTVSLVHPSKGDSVLVFRTIEDIEQRKQIEQTLQTNAAHSHAIFEQAGIGIMLIDINGQLLESNPTLQIMLGYSDDELRQFTFDDITHPDDVTNDRALFEEMVDSQREHYQIEQRLRHKDDSLIWVKTTVALVLDENNRPQFAVRMVEDITDHKQVEEAFRKAYRAYRMLSQGSQILVRADNGIQFLKDLCRVFVENDGYVMAWVGFAVQDESRSVSPAAYAGHESGYLSGAAITWDDTERGRGPTGTAIRTGQTCIAQHIATHPAFEPWRTEALQRGYASSIALPLLAGKKSFGVLSIYAPEPDAFIPDEIVLLEELANELAFGIMALRTRELHERAEQALRASEKKYRDIVETAQEGIWIIDAENRTTFVNRRMAEMLGYTVEEMLGKPYSEFMDEESREIAVVNLERRRQGVMERNQFTFQRKDGTTLYTLVSATPLVDSASQYAGAQALVTDISELKQAQAAEHDQRILAEALRDTAATLISALDLDKVMDTILENVSRVVPHEAANIMLIENDHVRVVRWRGYRPERDPFLQEFSLPLAETVHLRRMLDTQSPYLISHTDHDPSWVHQPHTQWVKSYVAAPIRSHGNVIGFLNVDSGTPGFFTEDHAQRMQAFADLASVAIEHAHLYEQIQRHANELEQRVIERTAQLNHVKERVESILNSSNDVMILCSTDGRIEQVNPAFDATFQCESGEVREQPLTQLAVPDHTAKLEQAFVDVIENQHPRRFEITVHCSHRRAFDADIVLSPIVGHDKMLMGVVCSLRDMTEHKQMQERLRQMLEHEMEISELKSRYLAMAAHDLRNPLAVIQITVSMMHQYGDRLPEERKQQKYDNIQTSIQLMVDMLDDILTLGSVESGKLTFEPALLDVVAFCQSIATEIDQAAVPITSRILFSSQGNCGMAYMDTKLLRHILTNLLTNALKYSPEEKPVLFTVFCEPAQMIFSVQDQGIGIPEADQAKLFETFHRASNVRQIPGTGLGLAIVKQSVELHGGTITFESEEGQGTIFTVVIPQPSGEAHEENSDH